MPSNVFGGKKWAVRHPVYGTEYHHTWQEAMDVASRAAYIFNNVQVYGVTSG